VVNFNEDDLKNVYQLMETVSYRLQSEKYRLQNLKTQLDLKLFINTIYEVRILFEEAISLLEGQVRR
jgi:hypothetical protein